ncbi:MAG: hypothetical protein NTW25_15480 [Candidatus Kapabacteria bacterium]|nr:hypothetical protein [Candidatus Kapabacteria bacterium]
MKYINKLFFILFLTLLSLNVSKSEMEMSEKVILSGYVKSAADGEVLIDAIVSLWLLFNFDS